MSEPFIAEIRIFPYDYAPRGWAYCDGQLLPIAQNTSLFSLIGTTYGGDGRTTMGLPNLQGRVPMHPGRGPGLTPRTLGEQVGSQTVAITEAQIPSHNHAVNGYSGLRDDLFDPADHWVTGHENEKTYKENPPSPDASLASSAISTTGDSQGHANVQPYQVLSFCIALEGLYPPRS